MEITEDLVRFLKEEEWFYAPDDESMWWSVKVWCSGKRLKEKGHISAWNTSNVTKFHALFYYQRTFNDNINAWDVSKAEDMSLMFSGAESFNQPLAAWNVSNVTNMTGMFWDAESFNQPLETWDMKNVVRRNNMFYGAINFNHNRRPTPHKSFRTCCVI